MEEPGVVPAEPATGGQDRFAVVFRGYDRQQVDEYVQALQERAARLERAVPDSSPGAPEPVEVDASGPAGGIGTRIERVLTLAEAEAAELRDDARRECSQLRAEAKRFKEDTERAARAQAKLIVAGAEEEVAELRAAARAILGDLARVEATIRNLMESAPLGREQNRVAPPSSRDSSAEPQPEEPPLPPVEEIVVPPSPRRAAPGKPRSSGPASMPQRRKTESKT